MSTEQTELLTLAQQFVNSTDSHVFLTGKAGTGKTTLLRNLASLTYKNYVVVAPTGIAALNAQGVTIHSQFLLPLGSFIPDRNTTLPFGNIETTHFYTPHSLARRHPLNSIRRQVLRAADLLIIDEVSMLRADILDAIDYRMRYVKGNFQRSFGGVQVLMIGDLYQLPPIVKDREWEVLRNYYKSIHFFEAHALRGQGMVYIELDKIFRQQDNVFIRILNNLRNNITTKEDIDVLNSYYRPMKEKASEAEVITITTHNYKAEAINSKRLAALPGDIFSYQADIDQEFPESLYPLPKTIELKEGAQVMFVKNDSSGEGRYFNGKLARVVHLEKNEIIVKMADSGDPYRLKKEQWQNKRYTIDADSKDLSEEVIGTFDQYPIKLAWAVTVHKSQGLTFDRAIIDVGQAFAPGQVYVALSRLRSLEGLILRTRISTASVGSDGEVMAFTKENEHQKPLGKLLKERQRQFVERLLTTTFDLSEIEHHLNQLISGKASDMVFEDEAMQKALGVILGQFREEKTNTVRFRKQLQQLLEQGNSGKLLERISAGRRYYSSFMEENLEKLLVHLAEVEQFSRTKAYRNALGEIDQLLMKKWSELEDASSIVDAILSGLDVTVPEGEKARREKRRQTLMDNARRMAEENPKLSSRKSGRRRKKKGETYQITFTMIREGKNIEEIAGSRGLAVSTIESHMARGIRSGDLRIEDLMSEEVLDEIAGQFRSSSGGLSDVHHAMKGKYSYGILRMVQAYLSKS